MSEVENAAELLFKYCTTRTCDLCILCIDDECSVNNPCSYDIKGIKRLNELRYRDV